MDRFRLSGYTDDERWFRVGTVDVTTTVLVTALGVLSLFAWAINTALVEVLVLYSDRVRAGQIWRVATWPFANAPDLWTVLGLALFYLFGREIERLTSRTKFAWMLGILTVVPGLLAVAIGLDHAGLQSLQFVLFGMYVLLYPQARTFFNLPLWVLGAVFLGIQVLQLVGMRDGQQLIFLALLIVTALLVMRSFGLGDEYPWIPAVPLPGFITKDPYQKANRARQKAQRAQQRRGDNVVPMAPRAPVTLDRDAQADMDRLLDKIAASGIDSLSAEERRRLDEHSRRLRGQ